jgi:DNA polymerase-3 subunit alpha
MTMDISNQNKLSEFYEELKRLNIEIQRPDINECFADFKTDDKKFYYALGAIKAVGYEAISNIVDERIKNGKFKSISDFLNRVNPKDINKLQLEGLVKAGAFDNLNSNRQSLFNSIPNLITKSKNIFENKSANQKDLFGENENQEEEIVLNVDDWQFEERLSKEFESVGFFISDHPLNQYKDIFDDYNIIDYQKFLDNDESKNTNIAATLLKINERKTAKGNSYAVLKLTDLTSVFELFIFSEILETNRETLKEGSSLILSLIKSISDGENRLKRINVQKISSLKELLNKPINQVTFQLKSSKEINEISKILVNKGETIVNIKFYDKDHFLNFQLQNKRNIDRKTLNLLRNKEISAIIS